MEKRQSRALPRIKQHTQQLTNKSRSERERAADYDQVLDQDSKHSTEADGLGGGRAVARCRSRSSNTGEHVTHNHDLVTSRRSHACRKGNMQNTRKYLWVELGFSCTARQQRQTSLATQIVSRGRANAGVSGLGEMGKIHAHAFMATGEQIDLAPPARLNSGDRKPVEKI